MKLIHFLKEYFIGKQYSHNRADKLHFTESVWLEKIFNVRGYSFPLKKILIKCKLCIVQRTTIENICFGVSKMYNRMYRHTQECSRHRED